VVITETTGAGQSEVEIGKIAQTVVVVLAPGMGNEIQAIKAGMMEIGDIFVVNKADKENVEKTVLDIENILRLGMKRGRWKPPVIKTIALSGEGVSELLEKVNSHKQLLETRMMNAKLKQKLETELIEAVKEKVVEFVIKDLKRGEDLDQLIQEISNKKIDLYSAAEKLAKKITRTWG
jgi:LAO/AO transport system kinase